MSPAVRPFFLRRRLTLTCIAIVGVLLSCYGFLTLRRHEADLARSDFTRRASIRHAINQQVIANYEGRVFGLRHLFIGSQNVRRVEFAAAAQDIILHYPGITALEWVPVIPASDRADVEADVSHELGRPFQFTARDAAGRMGPAPKSVSEHLPIFFVEPLTGNEAALGYDLAFGPTLDAIKRARATGNITSSRRVQLIQSDGPSRQGVILIWPVQRPGHTNAAITGFVQGVFHISAIIEESYRLNAPLSLDALYFDPEETDPAQRTLYYRTPEGAFATGPFPTEAEMRSGLSWEAPLKIGDRQWMALYRPHADPAAAQRALYPYGRLFGGFIITALFCALVHAIGRRAEQVEKEVAERTAELSESRRQLESLVQALPGMAFQCRYEVHLIPIYFSEGTLALTGYPAADFIAGRVTVPDVVHPEDFPAARDATLDALQHHRPFELEFRIRPRTGDEKWGLCRGHGVYDPAGGLRFLEGLIIDITSRKQAESAKLAIERRLLESHKLESLGQLAGGVAHDFNNLLTSIVGNAGLARLDLPANSPALAPLHQIELASQHAAELCQQMLAYAGKGRITMETVDLNALLSAQLPLVQRSIARTANLQLNLAPDLPRITADASQIRQLTLNFILNASDAIGDRAGDITVSTAFASVERATFAECVAGRELREGRYVILEVRDTGAGMTPETLARIFDPFFTTKFAGRGLGLAGTLGIVRSHSAALHVTSAPGRGTTFRLFLPPFPTPETAESPPSTNTSGRTFLIIDDDRPVCEVTAEVLRSFGHDAVIAVSGSEGLAIFRENPARFDAVLLDVVMPTLNGADTLERLRAIKPTVRVLMMSGQGEKEAMRKLAAFGPLVFATKPFNRATLAQKLTQVFAA